MKRALLWALLIVLCTHTPLRAEEDVIRIGVLTDLSGSMADAAGHGSVEAAEMALEDAARFLPRPTAIVTADYQSRSDLAEHISEDWLKHQNVDMVVDVPNPAIAARLQDLFQSQGKILLSSTPRRTDDAGACGMNSVFWLYDRDTLTTNLLRALVAEHKQRWFLLGNDTPAGMNSASTVKTLLQQNGGEVVGEAYLGQRMNGLSTIMEQIKSSSADVVFLAFDRPDILHLLRHWPMEAAGGPGPPLALPPLPLSDMYDLKDKPLPPFYMLSSFYWNQSDVSRAFSDRFSQRNHGLMPTAIHASVYSAVYHYLQSVAATNNKAADTILAHMKATPLQDGFFQGSSIRADGMVMHGLSLLLLKQVGDRGGPSDFFQIVRTLNLQDMTLPRETPCPVPIHEK